MTCIASLDATRIQQTLAARVAHVKGLLGRHIPQTRRMLRKLVRGRITFTPFDDTRGRGYALSASGSYAGLISEKLLVNYDGGGEGS